MPLSKDDAWYYYTLSARVRTGFFMANTMAFSTSTLLGSIVQACFTLMEMSEKQAVSLWLCLLAFNAIPLLFTLFAVIVDHQLDLVIDCTDKGFLPDLVSRLVFLGLPSNACYVLFCIGIEICPLAALVVFGVNLRSTMSEFIGALWLGGVVGCFALGVISMLVSLADNLKSALGHTAQGRRYLMLSDASADMGNETFVLKFHDWCDFFTRNRTTGFILLGVAEGILLVTSVCEYFLNTNPMTQRPNALLGFMVTSIALLLIKIGFDHISSRFTGPIFVVFVTFFFILTSLIWGLNTKAVDMTIAEGQAGTLFQPPALNDSYHSTSSSGSYPVCLMRWGHDGLRERQKLGVMDIGAFARAVYLQGTDVMKAVNDATENTDIKGVVLEEIQAQQTVGRWGVFYVPSSKVRIFAIRGTTTASDMVMDMDLFGTVSLLQAFNPFFPVLQAAPLSVIQSLASMFKWHQWLGQEEMWMPILNAATHWKNVSDANEDDFVVTGHSLGAGFAAIVGGSLGVPAIGFSPPGTLYSQERFGMATSMMRKSLVTIQPQNDVVPKVDKQAGFTQFIDCFTDALTCHSIDHSVCELYRVCDDPRQRQFSGDFDPKSMCFAAVPTVVQ